MGLQLEANRQVVLEDPGGQRLRRKLLMGRGEQDRIGTIAELVAHEVPAPFVIGSGCNDKLELVVRFGEVEVAFAERIGFAAAWRFDVDDLDYDRWDALDSNMPSCFQHDRIAPGQESIHKRVDFLVFERFAACHLNKSCRIRGDPGEDFGKTHLLSAAIGILRVAIAAPERATREANEDTRLPDVGRLALD
jgi:hypothetical protein